MKYTKQELELLQEIETSDLESVPFDNNHLKEMAEETLDYLNKKKQISINIKVSDLDYIKQKAKDIGIPYQSIIQSLIHNYSTNKLKLEL